MDQGAGTWVGSALFSMLYVTFGEFSTLEQINNGRGEDKYSEFLMPTIYVGSVTGLCLLGANMTIAVFMDIYMKYTGNKDMVVKTMKFSLLTAVNPMLPKLRKTKEDEPAFMIVIKPVDDERDKEEDWQDDKGLIMLEMKESINDLETNLIKMQNTFKNDTEVSVRAEM